MGMQRNTIAQSFDDTKLLAGYSGPNAVSPFLQKQERQSNMMFSLLTGSSDQGRAWGFHAQNQPSAIRSVACCHTAGQGGCIGALCLCAAKAVAA